MQAHARFGHEAKQPAIRGRLKVVGETPVVDPLQTFGIWGGEPADLVRQRVVEEEHAVGLRGQRDEVFRRDGEVGVKDVPVEIVERVAAAFRGLVQRREIRDAFGTKVRAVDVDEVG